MFGSTKSKEKKNRKTEGPPLNPIHGASWEQRLALDPTEEQATPKAKSRDKGKMESVCFRKKKG